MKHYAPKRHAIVIDVILVLQPICLHSFIPVPNCMHRGPTLTFFFKKTLNWSLTCHFTAYTIPPLIKVTFSSSTLIYLCPSLNCLTFNSWWETGFGRFVFMINSACESDCLSSVLRSGFLKNVFNFDQIRRFII